jgi:hypothetical protein
MATSLPVCGRPAELQKMKLLEFLATVCAGSAGIASHNKVGLDETRRMPSANRAAPMDSSSTRSSTLLDSTEPLAKPVNF